MVGLPIHSFKFYINFDYFYALYNIYAEFKFYINFDYFYAVFVQYLCWIFQHMLTFSMSGGFSWFMIHPVYTANCIIAKLIIHRENRTLRSLAPIRVTSLIICAVCLFRLIVSWKFNYLRCLSVQINCELKEGRKQKEIKVLSANLDIIAPPK